MKPRKAIYLRNNPNTHHCGGRMSHKGDNMSNKTAMLALFMVVIASVACERVGSSQPTANATPVRGNDSRDSRVDSTAEPSYSTTAALQASSPNTPTPVSPTSTPTPTIVPTPEGTLTPTVVPIPEGTPTPIPEYAQPVRAIAHCTGKSEEYWLDYVQQNRSLPTINKELAECYRAYIEDGSSGE